MTEANPQLTTEEKDIRALLATLFGFGYFAVVFAMFYMLWNGKIDVDSFMSILGNITATVLVSVSWYFAARTSKDGISP